jgi:hypothetical protein
MLRELILIVFCSEKVRPCDVQSWRKIIRPKDQTDKSIENETNKNEQKETEPKKKDMEEKENK